MTWSKRSAHLLSFFKQHKLDLVLACGVCLISLVSRWATLEPVELSGDPLDYWFFVKSWFYGGEFGKLDHHDARFGIHIWLFLVQLCCGESAEMTYVAPLVVSTVVTGLTYVLTRQLASRAAAVLASFFVVEFDAFIRLSSQIRPEMFGAMYILGASIALVAYGRAAPDQRLRPFLWAVALVVAGYLTRLDNLLFTPAFVVVLWLGQRSKRDVLLFVGLLVAGFLAETLLHALLAGGSRLSAEVPRGSGAPLAEYADVIERVTKYLEDSGKMVFYPLVVSAPALIALTKKTRHAHAGLVIALLPLSFLLLLIFGVRSLDPVRPFVPMNSRYLDAAAPHCMVAAAIVLQRGVAALLPRQARFWNRSATGVASLLLALGLLGGHAVGAARRLATLPAAEHPFHEARRQFLLVSDAYARGLPIVGPSDKAIGKGKKRIQRSPPLHWAYKGFIRSELLRNDRGKLTKFDYRLTRPISAGSRTMYLPGDLPAQEVADAVARRACAVELHRRGRFVTIRGSHTALPERCKSLREPADSERE